MKEIVYIEMNYSNAILNMSKLPKNDLIYIEYDDGSYSTTSPATLKNMKIPKELEEARQEVLFDLKSRNVKF